MLRQTNPWSDLVRHLWPTLLSSSLPDLLHRPKQLPGMFSVLNMYSHCLCLHVQFAHTSSNLLATFQLWSTGHCSQPRNADPPEQHGKTPPDGFPNCEPLPCGYAKSTLLSHLYPNIILLLYCTMRITCNALFTKTIKRPCRGIVDILWGYQALSFAVSLRSTVTCK